MSDPKFLRVLSRFNVRDLLGNAIQLTDQSVINLLVYVYSATLWIPEEAIIRRFGGYPQRGHFVRIQ